MCIAVKIAVFCSSEITDLPIFLLPFCENHEPEVVA